MSCVAFFAFGIRGRREDDREGEEARMMLRTMWLIRVFMLGKSTEFARSCKKARNFFLNQPDCICATDNAAAWDRTPPRIRPAPSCRLDVAITADIAPSRLPPVLGDLKGQAVLELGCGVPSARSPSPSRVPWPRRDFSRNSSPSRAAL